MKKPTLVVVTGVLLTLASVAMYWTPSRILQRLTDTGYDALLRHAAVEAQSDQVLIVDLDEASLQVFGQWPWPRFRVAQLTERLLDMGASVVLFDVLFAEPDKTSPDQIVRMLRDEFDVSVSFEGLAPESADFDRVLAETIRSRKVVLGCSMQTTDGGSAPVPVQVPILFRGRRGIGEEEVWKRMREATEVELPIPILREAAAGLGCIDADVDADNVLRRNLLLWGTKGRLLYPSLALEALRLHVGAEKIVLQYDETGITGVSVGQATIPTDPLGHALINYRRPPQGAKTSLPYVSAKEVLAGTMDASTFTNRIVFVGTSATGLLDLKATPLTDGFPGVETHATLVDSVLAGDVLRQPAGMQVMEVFSILFAGLLLTFVINNKRPWLAMLITALLVMAILLVSIYLAVERNLMFVPSKLLLGVLLIYLVLTSIRFWKEESERRRIRNMFGTMVSKDVMQYLEENPDSFSLEGRDVDATIFFSDIAGFTPIAEKLSAGEVTKLLNQYLSAMNNVIIFRKGYVDKYQGDAIMAVWGAPFPIENHAREACLAALEQKKRLETLEQELRKQFGHDVRVRMGINSGVVKAGNMGSEQRMQYTVIGDAVNQAARFEPLNKQYGTSVIIGETTMELAKDAVETRLLDRIIVKGKSEPVNVYELLAPKGLLNERDLMFKTFYETALRSHWERDWDRALRELAHALAIRPDDLSAQKLRVRVNTYLNNPPHMNWSGAYVYTTK